MYRPALAPAPLDPCAEITPDRCTRSAGADAFNATVEEVYRRFGVRVYSLAYRMLGNEADAEDVTQEVFLQVVRHLANFRGECDITTWLHRITVNAALALRRRRYRREETQTDAPLDHLPATRSTPSTCPEGQAIDRETRALLERSIRQLPEIYRDVFVLSDVEGLSNPEIGTALGLGLAAVKSRLHRARLLVREMLAPHFHGACGVAPPA